MLSLSRQLMGSILGKLIVTGAGLSISASALAWGETGHELVNRAAVKLMAAPDKSFFEANDDLLGSFAKTPDILWKGPQTYSSEKSLHFFQWDQYAKSSLARYFPLEMAAAIQGAGAPFVEQNGKAPWRVAQIYGMLKSALQSGDCARALQLAGVMGHYVGDLAQPMHNTSDFDGQSIRKPGIHKYFESTLVDAIDKQRLLEQILEGASSLNSATEGTLGVVEATVQESQTALLGMADVLRDFQSSPKNDSGLSVRLPLFMSNGAVLLAKFWSQASLEASAGRKQMCAPQHLTVSAPDWFPLQ